MACFKPLSVYRVLPDGPILFREVKGATSLELPCGRCAGCRLEYSRQWALRCEHEAKLHKRNCFITITYADEHLPPFGDLCYRDVQLFLKRLRKDQAQFGHKVRFLLCGEYGETTGRPHYHAVLFGVDFIRGGVLKGTGPDRICESPELTLLWGKGVVSIGDANFKTGAYVARYVMKKVNGQLADDHYRVVDYGTGEVHILTRPFLRMSLRPGIGAGYVDRYGASDMLPRGKVIANGRESALPRYYKSRLSKVDPDLMEAHAGAAQVASYRSFLKGEQSAKRLADREQVLKARLKFKKREL